MHRFRDAGELRPYGHNERAGLLDDAPGSPVDVRTAVVHRGLRIEPVPHRLDPFLPDVVVKYEISKMGVPLEAHAEHVLCFPLVPVCSMNPLDHARENLVGEGGAHQYVHPAACAFAVECVPQLPCACALLDDQAGEAAMPLLDHPMAHLGKHRARTRHFARRSQGVNAALCLPRPVTFDLLLQCGEVHGRLIGSTQPPPSPEGPAVL